MSVPQETGRHVGDVPLRPVAAALLSTTLATMPVFFLGGLATFVRRDLGFGPSGLGFATAAFFATGALLSVPGGRLSHRRGAVRTTVAAGALSAAALLGIAAAARSLATLMILLILAGTANAIAQPAANELMAATLPTHRLGLAFGIKQSVIPLSSLAAGLAVPVVALTLGWRWAFVVAALTIVPLIWLLGGVGPGPRASPGRHTAPAIGFSYTLAWSGASLVLLAAAGTAAVLCRTSP